MEGCQELHLLFVLALHLFVVEVSLEHGHRYGGFIAKASVIDQIVDDAGLILDAI